MNLHFTIDTKNKFIREYHSKRQFRIIFYRDLHIKVNYLKKINETHSAIRFFQVRHLLKPTLKRQQT